MCYVIARKKASVKVYRSHKEAYDSNNIVSVHNQQEGKFIFAPLLCFCIDFLYKVMKIIETTESVIWCQKGFNCWPAPP